VKQEWQNATKGDVNRKKKFYSGPIEVQYSNLESQRKTATYIYICENKHQLIERTNQKNYFCLYKYLN